MPQEAETITTGLASSMRVASSLAAKPPNTTEWTAPMRAQASMATSGLRHHRHVDDDPVALADPVPDQGTGEAGDQVLQLGVGDRARACR